MRPVRAILLLFIVCACCRAQTPRPKEKTDNFGEFIGSLELHPVGDGVHMKVLKTYSYIDPKENILTAKPGFSTDGASIPRALWTIVGSPFTGQYIGAAVIHDVGCETHQYSWQITHRMFYTAMRRLGVSEDYAMLLYWGVRLGGPRWEMKAVKRHGKTVFIAIPLPPRLDLTDEQVERIIYYIQISHNTLAGAMARGRPPPGYHSAINDYNRLPFGDQGLDEIDKRTPLEGLLPANATPY